GPTFLDFCQGCGTVRALSHALDVSHAGAAVGRGSSRPRPARSRHPSQPVADVRTGRRSHCVGAVRWTSLQSFFTQSPSPFYSYFCLTALHATLWATSSRESSPLRSSGSSYWSQALLNASL